MGVKDWNWRTKSGHLLSGEVRKNDTTTILRPGVCFREAGGEERGGGGQQETVTCQHLRTIRFWQNFAKLFLRCTCPPSHIMSVSVHKSRLRRIMLDGPFLLVTLYVWTLLEEGGKMRSPSPGKNRQSIFWGEVNCLAVRDRQSDCFVRSLENFCCRITKTKRICRGSHNL